MMSSYDLYTYDVFLSFRGIDTRSSFTASLNRKLDDKGIETFFDENGLQIGDEIPTSIHKAIQESKIAIVVLSENYASSSFCLAELVHILEHHNNKGALVLPIFHKVDPSDVRHQRGKYGEALAKHEEEYAAGREKMDKWKKALSQVADFRGYHVEQGDEDDLTIQKIVESVPSVINHAPLQGQKVLRLHDLINSMMDEQKSSEVLKLSFDDKQNKRKFQMDLTVELRHQQTDELNIIHVKFQLIKHCHFGENIFIVGDHRKLGEWDPSKALPMNWSKGDVWTAELDIQAGESIQFKFILKGPVIWQSGPNRILQPPKTVSGLTISVDWENAEC